jgi:hypothetical protein
MAASRATRRRDVLARAFIVLTSRSFLDLLTDECRRFEHEPASGGSDFRGDEHFVTAAALLAWKGSVPGPST